MAHDIYQDRRMFYAGETPWHSLGTKLPANATWEQARDAAGFYDALERPVFAQGITAGALPDVKALIASDDGRYLATVGKDYGVVQFSEMAKAVIEAAGGVGAIFTTGGLLGERGAEGWLLGELPNRITVKGGDEIRPFFLAYSGHDGRTPVTLANVATRVVCRNTVGAAMRERGGFRTSIRHTSNAAHYVTQAAAGFRALSGSFLKLGAWANAAAERRLSFNEFREILQAVHPTPEEDNNRKQIDRIDSIHGKILDLYESHEIPSTRGTAWAAFNALQGFAEHFAPTRARLLGAMTETARASAIAERGLFGAGADGSAEALNAVCAVANLPHPSAFQVAA